MTFFEKNKKEREMFIDKWSKYVRENNDRKWSKQQNVIIDSQIESSNMSKNEYLKMKKEI